MFNKSGPKGGFQSGVQILEHVQIRRHDHPSAISGGARGFCRWRLPRMVAPVVVEVGHHTVIETVRTAASAAPAVAFVIPAHDEERHLAATLGALRAAADAVVGSGGYEVVVVDDASSDQTAALAASLGATVVSIDRRQIAAARNAGARATTAPVLVFVDADTVINARALGEALQCLDDGALGGGAMVRFDGKVPWFARVLLEVVVAMFRLLQYTGGCFLFCRREAFAAVGGFDEAYFAGEEIELANALARLGRQRGLARRRRFRIVRHRIVTSGRKARAYGAFETLRLIGRLLCGGRAGLRSRRGLEFWYARREERG